MSTRKYVQITIEEMTDFLAQFGITETTPFAGERIFTHEYDTGKALVIYSSFPTYGKTARDRGADAIRLVVRNDKTGNHRKAGKVLRIHTWRSNLEAKILEAIKKFALYNTPCCVECGDTNVNGVTDEGDEVCAYHQLMVLVNKADPREDMRRINEEAAERGQLRGEVMSCRVAAFNWSY